MDPVKDKTGQLQAMSEQQESLAAKEKREHQKFLIKALLFGFGLTHEGKRDLLFEVMQDLDLIRSKVIEEVKR
jgi:hypothetical protein